jgi:hypothetical protein
MPATLIVLKIAGCAIITFFMHFLVCELAEVRGLEMTKVNSTIILVVIGLGCVFIAF